jgi:hypothetical protein
MAAGDTRMARAWKEAANDLGIEFLSPFRFAGPDGCEYVCSGLLIHFGGPKGTTIHSGLEDPDLEATIEAAEAMGFYTSGLSPHYYEAYDRELFTNTLNDWGWFGDESQKPSWYKQVRP